MDGYAGSEQGLKTRGKWARTARDGAAPDAGRGSDASGGDCPEAEVYALRVGNFVLAQQVRESCEK